MSHICTICNKKYKNSELYLKHKQKRHGLIDMLIDEHIIKCKLCQYVEPSLKTTKIFGMIKQIINENLVEKINAIFQFNITQNDKINGVWTVNLKNKNGYLHPGPSLEVTDCIIQISDSDLCKMADGELNHVVAYINGKLKVRGNLLIAPRLQDILNQIIKTEHMVEPFECNCIVVDSIEKVLTKELTFQ